MSEAFDGEPDDPHGECRAEIHRARAQIAGLLEMKDAAVGVAASLAATIYLLERGGKKAAPSDRMFDQMIRDYKRSLRTFRAAYSALEAVDVRRV